jgi:3-oxoacyl-[acyl-carrier-protein] synthase-3
LFNTFSNLNYLTKSAAKAILCCGDFSSRLIEDDNLSCLPIFSDAVSATAIEIHPKHSNVSASFMQETFGEGSGAIYTEMIKQKLAMKMNGIDVFSYSSEYVPSNIQALLKLGKLNSSEVDYYILHQANKIINTSIERSIGITPVQTASSLYEYGNTSSASIPITLSKVNPNKENINYLLSGFGVGFSIASVLLQNHPIIPVSMQVGNF